LIGKLKKKGVTGVGPGTPVEEGKKRVPRAGGTSSCIPVKGQMEQRKRGQCRKSAEITSCKKFFLGKGGDTRRGERQGPFRKGCQKCAEAVNPGEKQE